MKKSRGILPITADENTGTEETADVFPKYEKHQKNANANRHCAAEIQLIAPASTTICTSPPFRKNTCKSLKSEPKKDEKHLFPSTFGVNIIIALKKCNPEKHFFHDIFSVEISPSAPHNLPPCPRSRLTIR